MDGAGAGQPPTLPADAIHTTTNDAHSMQPHPLSLPLLDDTEAWLRCDRCPVFELPSEDEDEDEDNDSHWLDVSLSNLSALQSHSHSQSISSRVTESIEFFRSQHRSLVADDSSNERSASAALRQVKAQIAAFIQWTATPEASLALNNSATDTTSATTTARTVECAADSNGVDVNASIASSEFQFPSLPRVSDIVNLDTDQLSRLNYFVAPMIPTLPFHYEQHASTVALTLPPARQSQSQLQSSLLLSPLVKSENDTSEEVSDDSMRRKRRRLECDVAQSPQSHSSVPIAPYHRLLSQGLGTHLPQLQRVRELKQSTQHKLSRSLHRLIREQERKNDEARRQQQEELRRRADSNGSSATMELIPKLESVDASTVAVNGVDDADSEMVDDDTAANQHFAPQPAAELASHPLLIQSMAQLHAVLPPVIAIHLAHSGFLSSSTIAVQTLTNATVNYLSSVAVALRAAQEKSQYHKSKTKARVKSESSNDGTDELIAATLLRQLGINDLSVLTSVLEDRCDTNTVRQRLGKTASNLRHIDTVLTSGSETEVRQLCHSYLQAHSASSGVDSQHDGISGDRMQFHCEPFSPLHVPFAATQFPPSPPPLPSLALGADSQLPSLERGLSAISTDDVRSSNHSFATESLPAVKLEDFTCNISDHTDKLWQPLEASPTATANGLMHSIA